MGAGSGRAVRVRVLQTAFSQPAPVQIPPPTRSGFLLQCVKGGNAKLAMHTWVIGIAQRNEENESRTHTRTQYTQA
jgi:hypothetical protein